MPILFVTHEQFERLASDPDMVEIGKISEDNLSEEERETIDAYLAAFFEEAEEIVIAQN